MECIPCVYKDPKTTKLQKSKITLSISYRGLALITTANLTFQALLLILWHYNQGRPTPQYLCTPVGCHPDTGKSNLKCILNLFSSKGREKRYPMLGNKGNKQSTDFLKILTFTYECVICMYVLMPEEGGHRISLWIVMTHHVVAGNWIQDICKSSQYILNHRAISPAPYTQSTYKDCLLRHL